MLQFQSPFHNRYTQGTKNVFDPVVEQIFFKQANKIKWHSESHIYFLIISYFIFTLFWQLLAVNKYILILNSTQIPLRSVPERQSDATVLLLM